MCMHFCDIVKFVTYTSNLPGTFKHELFSQRLLICHWKIMLKLIQAYISYTISTGQNTLLWLRPGDPGGSAVTFVQGDDFYFFIFGNRPKSMRAGMSSIKLNWCGLMANVA